MTRGERAEQYFREGYNCAQAVALAWAEELNLPEGQIARLASSFGGGVGGTRGLCGTLSGAALVAGALYGPSDPSQQALKKAHYARIRLLMERFAADMGAVDCSVLLGQAEAAKAPASQRTQEYMGKRPCAHLVHYAADLLDRAIGDGEFDARLEEG